MLRIFVGLKYDRVQHRHSGIHPPDVVEKYAPDAITGVVGNGKAKKAKGAAKSTLPVATDKGDPVANLEARGDWKMEAFDDTPEVLLMNVRSYVNACYYLLLSIIYEICATIFSAKNSKISKDRSGITRSAVFLIFLIVCMTSGICMCSGEPTTSTGTTISLCICNEQDSVIFELWRAS